MNETMQTKATTIGGTLTILFANINNTDVLKTVVMATIGAIVSFVISQVMKKVMVWWKRRPPKSP